MKKITAIELENFRAFYGPYIPILLPGGENVLIYGENGSGKSSFFKAASNFFSSSRDIDFPFRKNNYQLLLPGHVKFTFHDFDNVTKEKTSAIGQVMTFGSDVLDTSSADFLKITELTKGFLDYRRLLDVYNHKEPKPNLFDLIVLDLLENYIPPGSPYALGKKWTELYLNSRNVYTRNERKHKRVLEELPGYEGNLRTALDQIFAQLNALLIFYFKLNLRVSYTLLPVLPYNYVRDNWHPTADLRLNIKLNGTTIDNQGDVLNEARLSALSICLYLAAILRNPQIVEHKILFLDDVFVGLDTGNRIPILNILQDKFSDYQVFISTYDRHWFEVAKRYFEVEAPNKWYVTEFYVGSETNESVRFEKPIVVNSESNYHKGVKYLHDRSDPDYPAAANYFRKAVEETIQDFIPTWELVLEDNSQIPDYKLTLMTSRAIRFLQKTGNSVVTINKIIALLPALLHPFSHHNISSPIYKTELLIIQNLIPKLKVELGGLHISENYRCSILDGRNRIKIRYVINAGTGHFSFYELRTTEPLTLKKTGGIPLISRVHCVVEKVWGENNGVLVPGSRKEFTNEEKTNPQLNFDSLEEAFERLYAFIITVPAIGVFAKPANYIDEMSYMDQQGLFQPLTNAIVWEV